MPKTNDELEREIKELRAKMNRRHAGMGQDVDAIMKRIVDLETRVKKLEKTK